MEAPNEQKNRPVVRQFDLEERTFRFAKRVRELVKKLPKITANFKDGDQLIRSSGSVGANYIEANEALSRKDFIKQIKISLKEAKESRYWLQLIDVGDNEELEQERLLLIKEAYEFVKIFCAILHKMQGKTVREI